MIESINIENFKSIQSLKMDIGRFNVIIGENGSGKTNILEAIAMASAASQNKLDHEFLASRGIRVTEPQLMRSGFDIENVSESIKIFITQSGEDYQLFSLKNKNKKFSKWEDEISILGFKLLNNFFFPDEVDKKNSVEIEIEIDEADQDFFEKLIKIKEESKSKKEVIQAIEAFRKELPKKDFNFLIFCPENSSLRNFYQEGQIQPLGIKGEGLFRLLTAFAEQGEPLQELKENLQLIEWFEDFEIKGSQFGERTIFIRDRYLDEQLAYFSQRSANEGFLYLLFYFSLFISEDTPKFFAIDNIENALNPRLCRKLMPLLFKLAEKYDKQVIFTTHNPAILDGLDLKNDQQRLFVARRNKLGHTKINRVQPKAVLNGDGMKLSEAFMEGHLGGIPTHF